MALDGVRRDNFRIASASRTQRSRVAVATDQPPLVALVLECKGTPLVYAIFVKRFTESADVRFEVQQQRQFQVLSFSSSV